MEKIKEKLSKEHKEILLNLIQINNEFKGFEKKLNAKINKISELSIIIILLERTLKGYIKELNGAGFTIEDEEHIKLKELFNIFYNIMK